ncbi:Splicing factor-like protein [Thalictrum thalictroides]|uniref:Splicing factor-like protein n=1 Tax=Thalictrum thalictroides TaxID=46969 RepID=A0A7J6W7K0_THATH|nr:Splicing factor-like protein [Thalictrum thalictroides]
MAMKVDKASFVEPRPPQNTINSSPAALTSSPKVSKFGLKSGFVIPKNKLSGSLVPVFRGSGKVENDAVKEESNKQMQRKTKWGTDLTQDATVRRGRALAYQTRVDQIAKQLKSGVPGKGESDLSSQSPNQASNDESSRDQDDDQSQKLEMEKREAIGELLKLNPSYKAPVDYKPLMKEANIPIPVKLNPGLNFVGLILGPGSNTQKRLEEETGARIQIQGTKAGLTEKVEITLSDKNDVQGAYEELYVHVSADTYEKVDAAVALIDLLVTPVSGNSVTASTAPSSVSGDTGIVLDHNQETYSFVMPGNVINQGMMQSTIGPMQSAHHPQDQFHPYPAPWFPSNSMRPPNTFGPTPNSLAPMPNSVMQFPTSLSNPSRMPQFLVGPPPPATGSGFAPRNLASTGLQPPMQGFQWPYLRETPPHTQGPPMSTYPTAGSQPHLIYPSVRAQPNFDVPHQGSLNHQRTTSPVLPSLSQPPSPMGQPPNRPLASSGWSGSTVATPPQSFGLFQRPQVASHALVTSATASSNVPTALSGNMVPPASFPSRPSTAQPPNTLVNHPSTVPNFSFVIHQRSPSAPSPGLLPSSASLSPLGAPAPSLSLSQSSPGPRMQQVGSQGLVPNLSNSATTPKPQRPSSGDFTFQPLGSTPSVSQAVPRASEQPSKAPPVSLISLVQSPPAPQAPFYRPPPQLVMQGFPSNRPINQMVQSPSQVPPSVSSASPYPGNPSPSRPPPRFLEFAIQNPVSPLASVPRMGPRSFAQAQVVSNSRGPFRPQMINAPQLQHNQLNSTARPGSFMMPNQQYSNNIPFSSRMPVSSPSGNQVYDPFSPTSATSAQQLENQTKIRKQEDDPEYDDLMASVGVR